VPQGGAPVAEACAVHLLQMAPNGPADHREPSKHFSVIRKVPSRFTHEDVSDGAQCLSLVAVRTVVAVLLGRLHCIEAIELGLL
jgi:hypothetical protein